MIEKFEDLLVWQEGLDLAVQIYSSFKFCKDYGFKDQIQRAAISISSNIAEGYDRQTNKEFIQFLFIAKGSCAEVRTQIYLAEKVQLLSPENALLLLDKTNKIYSMLTTQFRKMT